MAFVSLSQKKQVKNSVGLTDKRKIEYLMKYLNLTISEFCIEFKVSKKAIFKILNDEDKSMSPDLTNRIILLYPDISRDWLHTGKGYMNIGLYPNIKLSKSIESAFNANIDRFMSSKYVYGLSKILNMTPSRFSKIIDNYVQMEDDELVRVAEILKVSVENLVSPDDLPNYKVLNEILPTIVKKSIGYPDIKHIQRDMEFKDINIPHLANSSEFYNYLCRSLKKNLSISDVAYLTSLPLTTVSQHLRGIAALSEYSVLRYSKSLNLPIKELKSFSHDK